MAMKRRGLGRGLNALLAGSGTPDAETVKSATELPIKKIKPNPFQPRIHFDENELSSLAASIRTDGVLMPILVRPAQDHYELIAGERRWRASQLAGLKDIPAVIREVNDRQALELAIIENEHRDDLSATESARAYQRLHQEFSLTKVEISQRIGVSRSQVTNLIRLLQLPEAIQTLIDQREIGMGHARPLIGMPEEEAIALAQRCVDERWSVRQVEQATKQNKKPQSTKKVTEPNLSIRKVQDEISQHIGLAIQLKQKTNGKGEMRIQFKNQQEMDEVIAHIKTMR